MVQLKSGGLSPLTCDLQRIPLWQEAIKTLMVADISDFVTNQRQINKCLSDVKGGKYIPVVEYRI